MALLKRKHVKHLDGKLKLRLRLYFAIAVIMIGVVLFEIYSEKVSLVHALLGLTLGLLVGIITARMYLLSWDKDAKKVISRLDLVGGVILVFYIAFAVFRGKIIGQFVEVDYVTGTSLSVVAGIMVGRVFGTGRKIMKILTEQKLLR